MSILERKKNINDWCRSRDAMSKGTKQTESCTKEDRDFEDVIK